MKRTLLPAAFAAALCCAAIPAARADTLIERLGRAAVQALPQALPQAHRVPDSAAIESAFSPDAGGEALVLKVLDSAEHSVLLAAYSFTSPPVVRALMAAKRRGVDVRVVVDDKANRGKASIAALNLLAGVGIPTRTIARYAIHHDKFIVADGRHVQNGSFNYSKAAARANSENVIVVWNDPGLAAAFTRHWQSRWGQGMAYRSSY